MVSRSTSAIKGKYTRLSALYKGLSSDGSRKRQAAAGDGDVLAGTVKFRYSDAVVAFFKGQGLLYAHDEMYGGSPRPQMLASRLGRFVN
jgi:hypothetical protein